MSARKSVCKGCGLKFDGELMTTFNKKKYCPNCAKEKEKEKSWHKKLCKYIYENIYEKECNMKTITAMLKKMQEENNWSYSGMLNTLKYAIELNDYDITDLDKTWGVSTILSKYYYEAKKFSENNLKNNQDEEFINYVLTKEPVCVMIKRSDIIERQERDERERKKRYGVPSMDESDVEEILENYRQNGSRETGIF